MSSNRRYQTSLTFTIGAFASEKAPFLRFMLRLSRHSALILTLFALLTASGCFGNKGDSNSFDVAISSPAVDQTVAETLQELQRLSVLNGTQKATICFLGVTGSDNQASGLSAETRRQFESRSSFRLLENSAIQAALKESDVKANNLFIPAERKKFIASLGEPVDYLLTGSVETLKKEDDSQQAVSGPVFKLTLVELSSNKKFESIATLKR